jgi:hypothetical protein
MTEFDRYVFYFNKGKVYFLVSWANMASPGPFTTLEVGQTLGM